MIQDIQNLLRTTLAASSTFQSLVGAGNANAALARIYHDAWPKPASGQPSHSLAEITAIRPAAIVYTDPDDGFVTERDAMGDDLCWHQQGTVHAIIFRNVPDADKDNPSKVDTDFRVVIGGILADLIATSETAGYLACRRLTVDGPHRTAVEDLNAIGDAQAYDIRIDWGVRG